MINLAVSKCLFRKRTDILYSSPNNSGNRYRVDFAEGYDEKGIYKVSPCGKTDFQEYIDSFFDDVDIYSILNRILCNSSNPVDVSERLNQYLQTFGNNGFYGDISDMPKNIHEVNKGYAKMVEFFKSLPSDIRLEYNNSVDEFVAGFDTFVSKYGNKSSSEPVPQEQTLNDDKGDKDNG